MLQRKIGDDAEKKAEIFLSDAGFELIDRNFLCKCGEIDLIMRRKNTLIFVEVKTRKSHQFGTAAEMVSKSKQRKIALTAKVFLQKNATYTTFDCRFDVVAFTHDDISWIENAFYPAEAY